MLPFNQRLYKLIRENLQGTGVGCSEWLERCFCRGFGVSKERQTDSVWKDNARQNDQVTREQRTLQKERSADVRAWTSIGIFKAGQRRWNPKGRQRWR